MKFIGGGRAGGGWGGCWGWVGSRRWEIPSTVRQTAALCPQKVPQSTVVGSSLAHHVALLVPLGGSIDPVVDRHGFTGSAKDRL